MVVGRKRTAGSRSSRCRMSASTMEALELFHKRSVAVSHTQADGMSSSSLLLLSISGVQIVSETLAVGK